MGIEERLGCEVEWGEETFPILIYFPVLEIKNHFDRTHVIRDLYIKIDEDGGIYGMRTSFTKDEIFAQYSQSHLRTLSIQRSGQIVTIFPKWEDFCLGQSEIQSYLHTIAEKKINIREGEFFDLFLISLKNYLQWESLNGGPFIRMSTIGVNSVGSSGLLKRVTDGLIQDVLPIVLNHSKTHVRNGKLEVAISDTVIPLIRDILPIGCFCHNIQGNETGLTSNNYSIVFDDSDSFYFKGVKLQFTVLNSERREVEYPVSLNSEIKKQLANEIRGRIFKRAANITSQSRDRIYSESGDSRSSLEENKLVLF